LTEQLCADCCNYLDKCTCHIDISDVIDFDDETIPMIPVDKDGKPLDEKTLKLLDELGENNMKNRREHPELYEDDDRYD